MLHENRGTNNPTIQFDDRIAGAYDLIADASEHSEREAGEQALDISEGGTVLEIGSGTGHSLASLANTVGVGDPNQRRSPRVRRHWPRDAVPLIFFPQTEAAIELPKERCQTNDSHIHCSFSWSAWPWCWPWCWSCW